jgi:hypothetical protein
MHGDACEVSFRGRWFPSPSAWYGGGTQCLVLDNNFIWSSKTHRINTTPHVLDLTASCKSLQPCIRACFISYKLKKKNSRQLHTARPSISVHADCRWYHSTHDGEHMNNGSLGPYCSRSILCMNAPVCDCPRIDGPAASSLEVTHLRSKFKNFSNFFYHIKFYDIYIYI